MSWSIAVLQAILTLDGAPTMTLRHVDMLQSWALSLLRCCIEQAWDASTALQSDQFMVAAGQIVASMATPPAAAIDLAFAACWAAQSIAVMLDFVPATRVTTAAQPLLANRTMGLVRTLADGAFAAMSPAEVRTVSSRVNDVMGCFAVKANELCSTPLAPLAIHCVEAVESVAFAAINLYTPRMQLCGSMVAAVQQLAQLSQREGVDNGVVVAAAQAARQVAEAALVDHPCCMGQGADLTCVKAVLLAWRAAQEHHDAGVRGMEADDWCDGLLRLLSAHRTPATLLQVAQEVKKLVGARVLVRAGRVERHERGHLW